MKLKKKIQVLHEKISKLERQLSGALKLDEDRQAIAEFEQQIKTLKAQLEKLQHP
jgi:predicted  nucleic acid-binding Zn-ribbon protein